MTTGHAIPPDEPTTPWPGVRGHFAEVNGVRIHYVDAGPADGPPVLLLHGFPEFSYSWRLQIPALAAAGFRVIAPDMRGYHTSSKPARVNDYRVEALVGDVVGLIDSLAGGRAAVVGHDWGGVVAWYAAMWRPERVERLAILNAPHPAAYLREVRRLPQLLRSWYVLFFQLPWLPEALMRWDDCTILCRFFARGPARPSPAADVRRYLHAISHPRALTSMIHYYRAAARARPARLAALLRPVRPPTLLIWGNRDDFLVRDLTAGLDPWVERLRVEHFPTASHWPHHDEHHRVNEMLTAFLGEGRAGFFPRSARSE